jgi:SEC-C motif-containing protein
MKCYCGTGNEFSKCCEPFLSGTKLPETPEQLMRSRYSAFCVKKVDYLISTTDPQVSGNFDFKSVAHWANNATFQKLEILNSSIDKNKGQVEFKAYYNIDNKDEIHHEHSLFRRHMGRWYFKDGKGQDTPT